MAKIAPKAAPPLPVVPPGKAVRVLLVTVDQYERVQKVLDQYCADSADAKKAYDAIRMILTEEHK